MNINNPLLKKFENYDEAAPFDLIKIEHYLPAIKEGIEIANKSIQNLKSSKEVPSFENTFLALEDANHFIDRAANIYFNLFSAEANEQHQALAQEISPLLAAHSSNISLDEVLFEKIKYVYEHSNGLDDEQKQVVKKTYLDFARNGALLPKDKKEKLRAIDQELSTLSPKFSENVLKATNDFELWIEKTEDLKGLPESAVEAAKAAATQKGRPQQWLFTLQYPSLLPFLTYAENRELREKLWKANASKSFKDKFDNQEVVLKTVQLRHDRAQLLGYSTHSDFVLEERMAKDPKTVFEFIQKIIEPSKKAAKRDLQEVVDFKRSFETNEQLKNIELKPWDFGFYSEKLKEAKYAFNEEDLRPYFKLENVIEGVFEHARRLYGLTFKAISNIPVYHPDVKTYEVREEQTNKYIGLFYADFFPRETKKGGAWMTAYREQGQSLGQAYRPHVSIVCNFTKPTPTKPSLLTYDEVSTLFHEFGHALHGLLSNCTYRSVAGTNVFWDFVELPSQIMENWIKEKESLDLFARHYETNAPIPAELVKKIKLSANFQAGYMSLRQMSFSHMDMMWHFSDPKTIQSVDDFENQTLAEYRLFPAVPGTNTSCSFSHIFAGGYSAGYYSYKWAEVLDADAFEYFMEKGLFNKDVADKFKNFVLSKGGSEHPMELYKKFRGREPDPQALLRRSGLFDDPVHANI